MTHAEHIDAFLTHHVAINDAIARLAQLSHDHFNAHPDKINWGHVGRITEIERLLTCVTDFAFGEGDNA